MDIAGGIQLHFDYLSRKALLRCDGKEYVLPDVYENKDVAEAAARRFVRERIRPPTSGKAQAERPADPPGRFN